MAFNLKIGLTFLLITLTGNSNASSIRQIISKIETDLKVKIIYNQKVDDTWSYIFYENCDDSLETKQYLTSLQKEYAKYPKGYFQLAGVQRIVLGKKMRFGEQYRAAVPDPYLHSLFLSIDGAYGANDETYLIHVMHHELHHCTEYAMWEDMNYVWDLWAKTNNPAFVYMNGGSDAYENLEIDWYSMTHPKQGFINLYSTTAQEEDRSELMALIMTDAEREFIFQYYPDDEILQKKLPLLLDQLNTFCKSKDNFWMKSMAELIRGK